MTEGPFAAVVDASVGIKLFVAEPLSNEAHSLFAHLADDPPAQLFVPDLFYIECTNILWKYTRRLGLPPEDARLSVERLGQLAITGYSTASLMANALDIAMEHGLTASDAAYVALARQLSHRRRSPGGCPGRDQGRHPAAGRRRGSDGVVGGSGDRSLHPASPT